MKKCVLLSLCLVAASLHAEMKIGAVDMMTLIRNHADYDRNKALVETTSKDYDAQIEAIKKEGEKLQADAKKYSEQYRSPMFSDKAKADIEKKLQDLQQKMMGVEQRYRSKVSLVRQELQDLEGRLLKATTEDLRARIDKFAEANGFDLILDKSVMPYCKADYEVTDRVLTEMGVDPAKAKGRNEGK